jgi:ferredoxin/flavodoxin
MTNVIYYFTGTGNSLKIAKDIIEKSNIPNFNIVSIAKNISNVQTFKPDGIVGFVFPVYYCGIPKIVSDFLKKIDLSNTQYVFIVAAYGSTGGNAGCIHQSKNILLQKNIRLNAGFYVKTVDNFIIWTWDVPTIKEQKKINKYAGNKIRIICEYISKRINYFDKSFTEYIGPIIFGYKKFIANVNVSDKVFSIGSQCNSCGICTKVCPTKNVVLNNGKPEWKSENCQKCLACLHLCPKRAIDHGKSTQKRNRYKNPFIKIEELYN